MSATDIFKDVPKIKYHEPAVETSWAEFLKVVESRRSVRVFDETTIPDKVVRDCLRAAVLAPTSSNLQSWEFYWVKNPALREKLVEACMSQPAAKTARALIVCVARTDTWKRNRKLILDEFDRIEKTTNQRIPHSAQLYYRKLVPMMYTSGPFGILALLRGVIFYFMGFFKMVPREPHSPSALKLWAVKSTALACENLMLAFRAAGFDSCPMEGMDSKRVKRLLNLDRQATVVMVVGAGRRAPNGIYGPRMRIDENLVLKEID